MRSPYSCTKLILGQISNQTYNQGWPVTRWCWISLRCPPSDRLVLLLLALSVIVAALRLPVTSLQGPLLELLVIQLALFFSFGLAVAVMMRWQSSPWVQYLRPAATVTVIFTCYTTLGKLGITAMPYRADGWLSALDTQLLGSNPTFLLEVVSDARPGRVFQLLLRRVHPLRVCDHCP